MRSDSYWLILFPSQKKNHIPFQLRWLDTYLLFINPQHIYF